MLVWYGVVAVRTLFLIVLTITTARAASARIEHFPSVYEAPGDLIRLLSGLGVCSWFIANLIILPWSSGKRLPHFNFSGEDQEPVGARLWMRLFSSSKFY